MAVGFLRCIPEPLRPARGSLPDARVYASFVVDENALDYLDRHEGWEVESVSSMVVADRGGEGQRTG